MLKNIDCGYSLEPHNLSFERKYRKYQGFFLLFFFSENFQFLEVKFSVYLNRCVLVMI